MQYRNGKEENQMNSNFAKDIKKTTSVELTEKETVTTETPRQPATEQQTQEIKKKVSQNYLF